MSLVKLTEDRFERFTLVTNPKRTFVSSSASGPTGSVRVFARENRILKETENYLSGGIGPFDETLGVEADLQAVKNATTSALANTLQDYMDAVSDEPLSAKRGKELNIKRLTPSYQIDRDYLRKPALLNVTMPYYRSRYDNMDFSYTNYNALNFFTSSNVPSDSAIIYPGTTASGSNTTLYHPSGAFTLDFQINPRYTTDGELEEFHAGTILHLSSTIAVSLVTGSRRDKFNRPSSFRVLLQLKHSADVDPSEINLSTANNSRVYPEDLVFVSDDNALTLGSWHHVAVRWGTDLQNAGSGSFVIDRKVRGEFNVPSSSIATTGNSLLFVGNYYDAPSTSVPERFFNSTIQSDEGLKLLWSGSLDPQSFTFTHPLNAEIHDIKMYNTYRDISQIRSSSAKGTSELDELLFYLPVHFTRESPRRLRYITQFEKETKTTFDPFNVSLAFQVAGHEINVEGFVRDFVTGDYPRLYNLTGTVHSSDTTLSASDKLYTDENFRKRNLTILPCDNGKFIPDFQLLASGTTSSRVVSGSAVEKFQSDLGGLDLKSITLRNLLSDDVLQTAVSGQLESEVYGASPEAPWIPVGEVPTVFQRTRDSDSNQITIFNVPSVFYGRRILPGSVILTDNDITGSAGKVSINLRDNGKGSLYRADASGSHSQWNSVGNVFYNEGVILLKSPHLNFFGKHSFRMEFKGERKVFVSNISVPADAATINSSSNPTYTALSASANANDEDSKFVYITNLTFHDNNLNVIARTSLAQPIVKRSSDRIVFKVKMDW